ncbi:hypothetical protein [Izhakiella capsodis]|uniref:hypothetical protein n=1 Tax=Izhakiella capsodis TaxID=1367852 RepID=UPI0011607DE9|nr:hypothetical protein [Izhakiella capsodis]
MSFSRTPAVVWQIRAQRCADNPLHASKADNVPTCRPLRAGNKSINAVSVTSALSRSSGGSARYLPARQRKDNGYQLDSIDSKQMMARAMR